ncbi:MAG: phenylalanine--tRNA ligase subunit beta [Candidatus Azobacteroides sp.]|nr:phenylalanine--tRNA ligase subunit beta [Candidatus Azobacteroides sp.]
MNISYNWLKEFVDFDLQPDALAEALTSIGLETGGVEEVQTIKGGLEGLVIGEVKTCISHPNSDHLHITTVDLGDGNPVQIVCGAPNVAAGQKVVVATVGTKLYSDEGEFVIKKSKIRGEESFGMICAEDEIGIGKSHDGIIVLPEDATVGMPAKDYYKVETDYILEVDITPNRIDAASHYGVARDLAAYLKQNNLKGELKRPCVDSFIVNEKEGGIPVTVESLEGCPRYSGLTIRGVEVKESPDWLKNRLTLIGLRPINNIVDVTNYILHETGQPLHCFDLNQITGERVIVKTLPEGSKFVTLDGVERTLSDKDLMICNAVEGMCIAGVFGGLKSGVTEKTKDIFLESAYFNPTWVRKTARRHGLNTDSSFRFERGCDPNNTLYVLKRAALLIQELAGGSVSGEVQDIYPEKINDFPVTLSIKKVHSLIGKEIGKETIRQILASLEIQIVSEGEDELSLLVPTYRVDVKRDVDVIEDILRIYGYNNIEIGENVKSNLSYQTDTDRSYKLQNLIAEQLTGCGFSEIMNNSLTKLSYYENSEVYPSKNCVTIINPLGVDLSVMRQTHLFGGLESIAYNRNRKNTDLRFYEFGNCYFFDPEKHAEKKNETVLAGYSEEMHLGIWVSGNRFSDSWAHEDEKSSIYELKAYVENIFARLGVSKRFQVSEIQNEIFSNGLQYTTHAGKKVCELGIVSKKILKEADIENTPVYFAEINWDILMKEAKKNKVFFSDISRYPSVKRDLALLVDKNIRFVRIEKIAFSVEKKLLKKVYLFDVYEGKNLPADKKSYAVSFVLQDETKTLTDKQIDGIMQKIQQKLESELGAQLR